jgi:pimeloyl-ACP methyl ester carboxylesterase
MRPTYLSILFGCAALLSATIVPGQESTAPEEKSVTVNGAKIYYEEYGQGEPLLLLHGFGRTRADWKQFISEFSKHYRVIAWDMRGHGRSTNPDTSKVFLHTTATKDLLALMDNLGVAKVRAIGHSSGGIIILQAATVAPHRFEAIVPVSAQINFSAQTREFIKAQARPEAYYQFNELEQQHGKIKGRIIARQFYHFHELQGDPTITHEQLAAIKARTLIVHGDNDFVPVDQAWEIYKNIPKARLWIVPNGWHLPHIGGSKQGDFTRIALEFLSNDWNNER